MKTSWKFVAAVPGVWSRSCYPAGIPARTPKEPF